MHLKQSIKKSPLKVMIYLMHNNMYIFFTGLYELSNFYTLSICRTGPLSSATQTMLLKLIEN